MSRSTALPASGWSPWPVRTGRDQHHRPVAGRRSRGEAGVGVARGALRRGARRAAQQGGRAAPSAARRRRAAGGRRLAARRSSTRRSAGDAAGGRAEPDRHHAGGDGRRPAARACGRTPPDPRQLAFRRPPDRCPRRLPPRRAGAPRPSQRRAASRCRRGGARRPGSGRRGGAHRGSPPSGSRGHRGRGAARPAREARWPRAGRALRGRPCAPAAGRRPQRELASHARRPLAAGAAGARRGRGLALRRPALRARRRGRGRCAGRDAAGAAAPPAGATITVSRARAANRLRRTTASRRPCSPSPAATGGSHRPRAPWGFIATPSSTGCGRPVPSAASTRAGRRMRCGSWRRTSAEGPDRVVHTAQRFAVQHANRDCPRTVRRVASRDTSSPQGDPHGHQAARRRPEARRGAQPALRQPAVHRHRGPGEIGPGADAPARRGGRARQVVRRQQHRGLRPHRRVGHVPGARPGDLCADPLGAGLRPRRQADRHRRGAGHLRCLHPARRAVPRRSALGPAAPAGEGQEARLRPEHRSGARVLPAQAQRSRGRGAAARRGRLLRPLRATSAPMFARR